MINKKKNGCLLFFVIPIIFFIYFRRRFPNNESMRQSQNGYLCKFLIIDYAAMQQFILISGNILLFYLKLDKYHILLIECVYLFNRLRVQCLSGNSSNKK